MYCRRSDGIFNVLQEVRWNSELRLLKSFVNGPDQFETVAERLAESGHDDLLIGISENRIKDLVAFLEPFETAMKLCEGDKQPTIQNVVRCYEAMLYHAWTSSHDESADIAALGRLIFKNLKVNV
jgi:hypothetical protein